MFERIAAIDRANLQRLTKIKRLDAILAVEPWQAGYKLRRHWIVGAVVQAEAERAFLLSEMAEK